MLSWSCWQQNRNQCMACYSRRNKASRSCRRRAPGSIRRGPLVLAMNCRRRHQVQLLPSTTNRSPHQQPCEKDCGNPSHKFLEAFMVFLAEKDYRSEWCTFHLAVDEFG